ncbi:MAG: hypothetical protein ABWX59_02805 [Microbacteriaceae bacterium]
MKDSEPRIDPRYNPVFQPGYDHAIHGSPTRLRPVGAVRKVLSREPYVSTEPARVAPLAAPQSGELPPRDATPYAAALTTAETADRPTFLVHGNPFLRALWVVGPALSVFGLWAQWQSVSMSWGGFSGTGQPRPEDYVLPQFLAGLGPWCTVLGLATIVTVLILHALTWRSRDE